MKGVAPLLVLLVACSLLAAITAAVAAQERETYTWVDSAGQRHYSDRPPPDDARQVRTLQVPLPGNPRTATPARATPASPPPQAAQDQSESAEPPTVAVVRPQAEETFVNTAGQVQVAVNVQPRMPDQGRVTIYLDGAVIASGAPGQQSFQLSPVYRGAHSVSAVLIDGNGAQIARSQNVTFYVRQQSLISPP